MSKGILVVVSGFSGSGKGTVMKRLMEKYDNYALSVSVTTRNPRPGEKDGEAYFFRTKEEFEQLIREDGLIEYAQYVENYYGTPRKYVEEQLAAGKDVILEIEIQGALKVKEKFLSFFLFFHRKTFFIPDNIMRCLVIDSTKFTLIDKRNLDFPVQMFPWLIPFF